MKAAKSTGDGFDDHNRLSIFKFRLTTSFPGYSSSLFLGEREGLFVHYFFFVEGGVGGRGKGGTLFAMM